MTPLLKIFYFFPAHELYLHEIEKRIILFLDEAPWLSTKKSGFISAIDHFWNTWASEKKNIKLIICGSAASWIIDKILNDKGGAPPPWCFGDWLNRQPSEAIWPHHMNPLSCIMI
jgi:hypothetical protein